MEHDPFYQGGYPERKRFRRLRKLFERDNPPEIYILEDCLMCGNDHDIAATSLYVQLNDDGVSTELPNVQFLCPNLSGIEA